MKKIDETKKATILIVEDEAFLCAILKDRFSKKGFGILQALNGKEGLKIALKECPDLILLDILMPLMDGMEMLEKLKADKKGKNIPVIILTNLIDDDKILKAKEYQVLNYLIKANWKLDEIVKKVEKVLKK